MSYSVKLSRWCWYKMVSCVGLPYMLGIQYENAWTNQPLTPISHLKSKLMCDKTDLRIKQLGVTNSDNFVTKFDWAGK